MMKKLLVLSLVLAVAGLASAALEVVAPASVNVGETFQIVLNGTAPGDFGDYGLYGDGAMKITVASKSGLAGNLGSVLLFNEGGFYGYEMSAGDVDDGIAGNQPGNGAWFTFDVVSSAAGTLAFDLYNYAISMDVPVQSFSVPVTAIPEPMTMGILGLGALFLRKRK